MPHRRYRKAMAICLGMVMLLFWCRGMVYPVKGELGTNILEIVEIEVFDAAEENLGTVQAEEEEDERGPRFAGQMADSHNEEAAKAAGEKEAARAIVVQKGDTLTEFAHQYGTTIAEITKLNGINEPDIIFAGQKLQIPVAQDQTAAIARKPSRGMAEVTQEELELLARVIHAEARGEDFKGQVAVGAVVLNRVKDQRFPATIHGVVYQQGAFTAVIDKQIHLTPNQSAYRAAEAALNGEDPTGGAIYYYNPKTATDRWIKTRPVVRTIGNHTFSI